MEYYPAIKNNAILSFAEVDGVGEHHVEWNKPDSEIRNNKSRALSVQDGLAGTGRVGGRGEGRSVVGQEQYIM